MKKKELEKIIERFDETANGLPRAFLKAWCQEREIPVELITMYCNKRPVVKLRKEAMRDFKKRYPNLSYPAIGKIFKRDHTTIMSALGVLDKNHRRVENKNVQS